MDRVMNKLDTALQVGRTFGLRDGVLRLQYELQRGSGLMSWKMRSVEGWRSWDLDQIATGIQAQTILNERRDSRQRFFFSDVRSLGTAIEETIGPDGKSKVLAEGEAILKGRLPFFGSLSFKCGFPLGWFQNPVTGEKVSPRASWTAMRFASPVYGDLKFILEPSRFLFVYPLVRAYALTGDDRFAEAFWYSIEDWALHSPPMNGPLWICGQECSLRILAWSFALHGFIHSPSTTSERVSLLFSMIAAHAWRAEQTIGYARSQRSNHLISEAVGLWTAGTLYPELRGARAWQSLGAELLHTAVVDQITPEGVSQQHSFNYQRMILHLLLWTVRLAEIYDVPLDQEILQRTQAASEFICTWVDPESGHIPNYGADDGTLILPLAHSAYRDFRPLLQLSAAALKRPALPQCGEWDEPAIWFGMGNAEKTVETSIRQPPIDTGYFRLGDDNSWAMIRAGRYTRRPFQADQLHVDLWWKGINLARDAGTYLYNGVPPWNNGLAGSAVHNTVTLDRQDQMRRAGRFLWVDWAQASGHVYSSPKNAQPDCFEGEHDGYKRIGVTHRRTLRWLPKCGWVIVDDLLGNGEHEARLHWLLADLPLQVHDSEFQVAFKSEWSSIRWGIFCSAAGSVSIVRAGNRIQRAAGRIEKSQAELSDNELQILGWESPTYGELKPAVSLIYQTRAQLPLRFVTIVLTNERCVVESSEGKIIVSNTVSGACSTEEVYRASLAGIMDNRGHEVSTPTK
ncbi:MAG TPA: alginate lyase family protein [Candidatus Sulfotelmatobacter sp.]